MPKAEAKPRPCSKHPRYHISQHGSAAVPVDRAGALQLVEGERQALKCGIQLTASLSSCSGPQRPRRSVPELLSDIRHHVRHADLPVTEVAGSNMARTKEIARKSANFKAPKKVVAKQRPVARKSAPVVVGEQLACITAACNQIGSQGAQGCKPYRSQVQPKPWHRSHN